jgi:ABC-type glycerol-3-phosphate transport system substrate-binding protein
MKTLLTIACAIVVGGCALYAAETAPAKKKNWTAPAQKIYAQELADKVLADHPELISVTFQGQPPGTAKDVYTMFAGSFPEGITILDPRWRRSDPAKKFVVLTPLRDAQGENVGLLVLAYKNDDAHSKSDDEFYAASMKLRQSIQKHIPSFGALFAPAGS